MDPNLIDTNTRIDNALKHLQKELANIRAGRANPSLIEELPVMAYGARMKLMEVGTIAAPQPSLLTITVWDPAVIRDVEKAILESNLGLNPAVDGQTVRLPIPPLTEERREEFVKVAHQKGREAFLVDYLDERDRFEIIELEHKQFFDLLPKESVVATTLEEIGLPDDLMAVLYPRSSVNRKGLSVDLSGIIDAGYEGRLLIPITNNTSHVIRLYPGERFCQLVFYPLSTPVKVVQSRWHKKDIVVGRLSEKQKVEEKLIAKGKIKELKQKYTISSAKSS